MAFTEKMRKSIRRQAGDKHGVTTDLLDEIDRLEKALRNIRETFLTSEFEYAAMRMDMIARDALDKNRQHKKVLLK